MSKDTATLPPSNIGYKLLRKAGWKDGTGLGAHEQGSTEPVQARVKKGKEGIGAKGSKGELVGAQPRSKPASTGEGTQDTSNSAGDALIGPSRAAKKRKRKAAKAAAEEQRTADQELQRAFFREFLPDNV